MKPICFFISFYLMVPILSVQQDLFGQTNERKWITGNPVLTRGVPGTFDETAVKDPSIVNYNGIWHLFYTARGNNEYTTGYLSATDLSGLRSASRHQLVMARGNSTYGCAPQVFYFEPQRKWYLIFQTKDADYQPVYSTTSDISDPTSWSSPAPLIKKDSEASWIDFWVICDDSKAYLFYTEDHKRVMVRSTSLNLFPGGWKKAKEALDGVHEAAHVYKVKDEMKYHMVFEMNDGGARSLGLAAASNPDGPWEKITDDFATGDNIRYVGRRAQWTEMVSHGEALRSGYNQLLEYEPATSWWIIQGILKSEMNLPYESLPWKLGFIGISHSDR